MSTTISTLLSARSKYYGPDATCTLDTCPVDLSVYQYRPSLAANAALLALFALILFIQFGLAIKWRTWGFFTAMGLGCITEIIGYAGRIMLWQNPFDFSAFIMQIVCITFGPVFYSAGIYITLSQIVVYLDPSASRFRPSLFYWLFIPSDIISLILQAAGGALSSTSQGSSNTGVDIAIAGLVLQVATLVLFILLAADYALRYARAQRRRGQRATHHMSRTFKVFAGFLAASITLILVRCVYRIDELSDGYSGPLIHNEPLFIALEGAMVVAAAACLVVAHPGRVFGRGGSASAAVAREGKADDSDA